MLDEVEREGDAERYVKALLDRGERLMGFGHRVYRAEDPRARVLRRTSREIGSHRFEVAEALEAAALAELKARKPDRVLATNVEFWSAVVLDHAQVPAELFTSMFTCARTAGWSAHILEQKREGRLIRPIGGLRGSARRGRCPCRVLAFNALVLEGSDAPNPTPRRADGRGGPGLRRTRGRAGALRPVRRDVRRPGPDAEAGARLRPRQARRHDRRVRPLPAGRRRRLVARDQRHPRHGASRAATCATRSSASPTGSPPRAWPRSRPTRRS